MFYFQSPRFSAAFSLSVFCARDFWYKIWIHSADAWIQPMSCVGYVCARARLKTLSSLLKEINAHKLPQVFAIQWLCLRRRSFAIMSSQNAGLWLVQNCHDNAAKVKLQNFSSQDRKKDFSFCSAIWLEKPFLQCDSSLQATYLYRLPKMWVLQL